MNEFDSCLNYKIKQEIEEPVNNALKISYLIFTL